MHLPQCPVVVAAVLSLSCGVSTGASARQLAALQNARIKVTVTPDTGSIQVLDRRSGLTWSQPAPSGRQDRNPFRNVTAAPDRIAFTTSSGGTELRIVLTVPPSGSDLCIRTDAVSPDARFGGAFALDSFLAHSSDAYVAIADYCNGHVYPTSADALPQKWFATERLDMPWVGVTDGLRGPGYLIIVETSDDGCVELQRLGANPKAGWLPRLGWLPSKGTFAYTRRYRLRFVDTGGYVALAKAYRSYARNTGLLVTLRQKARRNPNVRRLYGAVDVWGDASEAFARAAKAAGVERMLIHGKTDAEQMRSSNALGYLTSDYDNYTDILEVPPGGAPDNSHDHLPGSAVLTAEGKRMEAWLTYDKKTQYMKRCPSLWVARASKVISDVLERFPFLGRFIDVTTAEGLYECYDPAHPLDKRSKRRCGEQLLAAVRGKGLVVGGEHGIWWAVPYLDYIEGMMSSYQFAWPAGHLMRPKSKDEKFAGPYGTTTWEQYDKWGLGHRYRAPLWELVFHDCVVSTWYWGDSNDFLIRAAPEYTAKKEAFNVLYGTMPMLWAGPEGSWQSDRNTFVRAVHATCGVGAAVADSEMTDHRFLTDDGDLQRTTFANGTVCIVNFGATVRRVRLGGKEHLLPQNGFAVEGPDISQYRRLVDGRTVVTVRTPTSNRTWTP